MSSVNVNEKLEEIFVVWMFDTDNSGGDGLVNIATGAGGRSLCLALINNFREEASEAGSFHQTFSYFLLF